MAITFVQATFSTIDEYHDYTLSSAPTDGNILLFIGNFQTAGDVSDLTAEGFTVVFNRVGANDAVLAWKEASGDSAALMNLASSGFNDAGIVAEYSGVDTTTPIEDSDWDDDFNDSVAVAVTAGGDGRVHVIGVSMEGSTDFSSDGFTERLDDTTAGRTQLHDKVATSGVNGPFTDSGTLQTQVVFSFLLNPTAASNVAPGDPTGVAATAADSQATVTWSDGTIGVPEETYDVDRGTTSIGPWTSMATGLARSTQTYTDTSAANGTEYFYRVRGTNSEGASAWVVSNGATPQASTKVIKIQRGSLDVTASTTITLAEPVADLTKAYVRLVNSRNQGAGPVGNSGNQQPDDLGVTVQLTAVDTIAVGYSGGTGSRIEWEIMEYVGADGGPHEFRVRHRGEQTLAGATNTVSEAFDTTPTNIADCIPFWSVRSDVTSGSEFENVTARVQLSGSDQVDYSSAKDQGNTVIATEVVEYVGSAWAVHVGTQEGGTTDSGTITLGTSVSDWANAAVVSWGYEGDQSNEAIADHYPLLIPDTGTANAVDWRFDGNADGKDHDIVVYVLENASMAVTRYSWAPSGTAPVEGTVDIASAGLTELSRAAVYATAISSGSGTALGRGYRNAYLSTLVLLVLWCHRTGNTVEAHAEVVDYDGLEDAGSSATEGTAAFSGAGTMAAGGDVGVSGTAAFTGTGGMVATGVPNVDGAVAFAGAGTMAAGGDAGVSGTAAFSGTGTMVAQGVPNVDGAAAFSGNGILAAIGETDTATQGAAAFSGAGDLTVDGDVGAVGAVAFAGVGTMAATADTGVSGTAEFSGTGSMAAVGETDSATTGTAAFAGAGDLSVQGVPNVDGVAAFSGSGAMVAVGETDTATEGTAAFAGAGTMAATGDTGVSGTAGFSGVGNLVAQGVAGIDGAAAFAGAGDLAAQGDVGVTGTAVFLGAGDLSAQGVAGSEGTAGFSGVGSLTIEGQTTRSEPGTVKLQVDRPTVGLQVGIPTLTLEVDTPTVELTL